MFSASTAAAAHQSFDTVSHETEQDDSVLFERLVTRHQDRLYRVAYRMTGNTEEAQDLLQDAIVEAFRAFAHFRRGTYFDKWLYRIMSRTFIDRRRSQKRMPVSSLDEPKFGSMHGDGGSFEREIADEGSDPALMIDRSVFDHRVQEGLDKLPPEYRLVLILSDIEEFSYEEVATFLQCPIGTVRSRLHRAREKMRTHLTCTGYRS
jgi:RNA polymerase sigma-70 factor (ECF subfamily)